MSEFFISREMGTLCLCILYLLSQAVRGRLLTGRESDERSGCRIFFKDIRGAKQYVKASWLILVAIFSLTPYGNN